MFVTRSARKHGIVIDDIRRVLADPVRTVAQGDVVLHIGVTPDRDLLEVVVAPGEPPTVLHAMRLRPANYRHLATGEVEQRSASTRAAPPDRDPARRCGAR